MNASPDVIIVGAGIVGAACAWECARAGLEVLVLDRGPVGGGTTAAGMGHLVVMDDSEAQFALAEYSRRLWRALAPELPADVEFDPCGTLWVAADDEELAAARRKLQFYQSRNVQAEILNGRQLREAEPNLRPHLAGALHIPDDAVLYPPCVARFLLDMARRHGAELRTGVAVRELRPEGGVTLADGSAVNAALAVNAAGPWAAALDAAAPVRKRKGLLVITDRHPEFIRHQIIELGYLKSAHAAGTESVAFNIQPRKTGQLLIGSSRQFDVETATVEHPLLDRMLRRAIEYLPGLARLTATRAWAGHRAATPDKLPLIGPSPAGERIWLATGHEGLGITTSLGTGRLIADLMLGRATAIPAEPYLPARFAATTRS
jgi:glycine/D-amino acid oxidase-like deaminating enzyme